MFRSVVVSHDGSRCVEGTLAWLKPLLGEHHSHVELFGRHNTPIDGPLNADEHLEELASSLREAGAEVVVQGPEFDLFKAGTDQLVVVHSPDLAVKLLRDTSAHIFFTPEGIQPHVPDRILVALDGSKYTEEILPLLVPFARAFGTEVELLRVEPDVDVKVGALLAHPDSSLTTKVSLEKSLEGARAFLSEHGVTATIHTTKAGVVAERIVESAITDHADLVAVSTHGHNRLARWLFGSCCESLIESGKVPLLIRNTRE